VHRSAISFFTFNRQRLRKAVFSIFQKKFTDENEFIRLETAAYNLLMVHRVTISEALLDESIVQSAREVSAHSENIL